MSAVHANLETLPRGLQLVLGLGLAMQVSGMVWVGIVLFSAFVIFTLVTLPVEFNASSRAAVQLRQLGLVSAN